MALRPEATESDATPAFLQNVIDAYGGSIAILDRNQTVLYVNRAWRQFASRNGLRSAQFGVGSRYTESRMVTATVLAGDAKAIATGLARVIAKDEIEFEMEYQGTVGAEPVWFRLHAAGFRLPGYEDRSLILVSHNDISAEKCANALLMNDKLRLHRLLDSTNIVPWEADARTWGFTYIGERAEHLFGYPKESWFAPDFWSDHIHPDDKHRTLAEYSKCIQSGGQYQYEYRILAKNGRAVWVNDVVSVHRENGKSTTVSGFMIDITDRKLSEDTLKLLSGRLITAQEDERKRIARDLHDDLNQRMALMSIELEQIGQMLPNKTDGLSERIKGLQQKALTMSKEIHRMSYKLHPSKLDHLGLVPALKSFCSELSESRALQIEFRHNDVPGNLPANTSLCLFRVAQEALQNAAKHSGGAKADIVLEANDRSIELTVSDAGCGFDMTNGKMTEGLGFISMRERLRLVNGSLNVQSKPGSGTRIEVSVPVTTILLMRPVAS